MEKDLRAFMKDGEKSPDYGGENNTGPDFSGIDGKFTRSNTSRGAATTTKATETLLSGLAHSSSNPAANQSSKK